MRRPFALIVLLAASVALAACGRQEAGDPPGGSGTVEDQDFKISYFVSAGTSSDTGFKVQFGDGDGKTADDEVMSPTPVWTKEVTMTGTLNRPFLNAFSQGPLMDMSLQCQISVNGKEMASRSGRGSCQAEVSLKDVTTGSAAPTTNDPWPKRTSSAPKPPPTVDAKPPARPVECKYATDAEIEKIVKKSWSSATVLRATDLTGGCAYMFGTGLNAYVNITRWPGRQWQFDSSEEKVSGLGSTASWNDIALSVQKGSTAVSVYVSLPEPADRKQIAIDVYKLIKSRV